MTMYAVTPTVAHYSNDGWTATRQLPTFYLDSNVQGIVSEQHAQTIAQEIFAWVPESVGQVSLTVVEVEEPFNRNEWLQQAIDADVIIIEGS